MCTLSNKNVSNNNDEDAWGEGLLINQQMSSEEMMQFQSPSDFADQCLL